VGGSEVTFAALVAAAVLVVGLAARAVVGGRAAARDARLDTGDESGVDLGARPVAPATPMGPLARFDAWFDTAVRRAELDASPAGVVAVMMLLAVAAGGGLYLWKESLGLAGLGIVVGLAVPLAVVTVYYRAYRWRLQAQLPDAYRMLAGSVRANQSLEQAIEFYAKHGGPPLAEHFAHCAGLLQLGLSPVRAVQSTAERVRLLDFDLLVATVALYTTTGGNLTLLLERLADSVRDRNDYANQFFAATAQSRAVALAIGAAAPLLLLGYVLFEPDHVQRFLASPSGWAVLAVCAALEVIGAVWVWRVLRVKF
jgi:tight adherence protein B